MAQLLEQLDPGVFLAPNPSDWRPYSGHWPRLAPIHFPHFRGQIFLRGKLKTPPALNLYHLTISGRGNLEHHMTTISVGERGQKGHNKGQPRPEREAAAAAKM